MRSQQPESEEFLLRLFVMSHDINSEFVIRISKSPFFPPTAVFESPTGRLATFFNILCNIQRVAPDLPSREADDHEGREGSTKGHEESDD